MMDTRMWKTACSICKWSSIVYSQETADAAKRAHEQIKKHKNVTVQPLEGKSAYPLEQGLRREVRSS